MNGPKLSWSWTNKISLKTMKRYLTRRNFRADKFSRIFAQNLNLREIARKLVLNFFILAHKKIRDKFSQNLPPCFSFVLPYIRFLKSQNLKVRENTRKFVRAKIYMNKVMSLKMWRRSISEACLKQKANKPKRNLNKIENPAGIQHPAPHTHNDPTIRLI